MKARQKKHQLSRPRFFKAGASVKVQPYEIWGVMMDTVRVDIKFWSRTNPFAGEMQGRFEKARESYLARHPEMPARTA